MTRIPLVQSVQCDGHDKNLVIIDIENLSVPVGLPEVCLFNAENPKKHLLIEAQ